MPLDECADTSDGFILLEVENEDDGSVFASVEEKEPYFSLFCFKRIESCSRELLISLVLRFQDLFVCQVKLVLTF